MGGGGGVTVVCFSRFIKTFLGIKMAFVHLKKNIYYFTIVLFHLFYFAGVNGEPVENNFRTEECAYPHEDLLENHVLVKTLVLSVDPALVRSVDVF